MFKKLKIRNLKYPTSFHDSMNEPIHSAFKLTAKWNLKKGIWKENSDEWKTIIPPPPLPHLDHNKQILKGVKIRSNNPLDKSCLEPKPGYTVSTPFYRTARTKSKFSIPTGNNLIRHFHATHNIQLVTSRRSKKSKRKKRERKGGGEGRGGKRNGLYT